MRPRVYLHHSLSLSLSLFLSTARESNGETERLGKGVSGEGVYIIHTLTNTHTQTEKSNTEFGWLIPGVGKGSVAMTEYNSPPTGDAMT